MLQGQQEVKESEALNMLKVVRLNNMLIPTALISSPPLLEDSHQHRPLLLLPGQVSESNGLLLQFQYRILTRAESTGPASRSHLIMKAKPWICNVIVAHVLQVSGDLLSSEYFS